MSLREYLKAIKIDEIEDDREFCEEEYNSIHDYCDGQKYCLSENDENVINERGLQDSFNVWKWNYIIELWCEFGDIPMNPDTECIEKEWNESREEYKNIGKKIQLKKQTIIDGK